MDRVKTESGSTSHGSSRNSMDTKKIQNDRQPSKSAKSRKVKSKRDKKISKHSKTKKKRKRRRSSSSSDSSDSSDSSSSSSSDTSSSSSSSSDSSSDSSEEERARKRRRKRKAKLKKEKNKRKLKAAEIEVQKITSTSQTTKAPPDSEADIGPSIDLVSSKARAPMTKEEYEKLQSTLSRVIDPETGRHRLIRGTGEVVEEMVSKYRHAIINKEATRGDGRTFEREALTQAAKNVWGK